MSIKRLMIEKISGGVAFAVMSFGGFLGMGTEEHAVPNKLPYDTNLGGYRASVCLAQPPFALGRFQTGDYANRPESQWSNGR